MQWNLEDRKESLPQWQGLSFGCMEAAETAFEKNILILNMAYGESGNPILETGLYPFLRQRTGRTENPRLR